MFSEAERKIFKFYNGERELYGDPLAIERKLRLLTANKPGELAQAASDKTLDDVAWAQADEKLVSAVREAFGMVPFSSETGLGATDAQCKQLWNDFWGFLEQKKSPRGN